MKKLLLILIMSKLFAVSSQQPAYFILGENQFKGLKVFDIIQDFNQNYYFATNEGIIKYDFIQYSKINVAEAKSVSFFNFTINTFGTIYFNNLNNQIFEIKNGQCRLFYELNGDYNSNIIHLTNDHLGNLMIGCKGLIILNPNGKVLNQIKKNYSFSTSYQFNKNSWVFSSSHDSVLIYSNNKIFSKKLYFKKDNINSIILFQFFDLNDSAFALDLISKKLYSFNKVNWILTPIESNNFFNTSTNARMFITGKYIWTPSSISGINFSSNGISNNFKTFYNDVFISDVFQDKEGNFLLGTFDKGIIVIPNINIPDVINPFSRDPMISLFSDENLKVYLGSSKGLFYEYNNQFMKPITSNSKKPIEGIYGSSLSKYLIFDDEKVKCYNKTDGSIFSFSNASLKDVSFISSNEMYLGTNMGILKVKILGYNQFKIESLDDHKMRIYSLAFNNQNKTLYSSSANGFYAIKNDISSKITFQKKELFPEKIVCFNGNTYVISRDFGLLKFDINNQIQIIKPKFVNEEEKIRNICVYKNTFIVSTSNGLYQMNEKGDIVFQFHSVFGFSSKKVYNFSVYEDILWVSHLDGVQKIDLKNIKHNIQTPIIILKSFDVNNINFNNLKVNKFKSNENKFTFNVYSPSIRNIENIKFHYRLVGLENNWQIQNAKNNKITYNALSPGQYELIIKAENLGNFSNEIKYSFEIFKPYYLQWWFISILILLFLTLVYLVYKFQLNRQKEKSKQINELNLSKLTAIQSQMNPHFIFNSLNSIQDLVLQQNATKAYDSIGKFALLIRKIMHHSEKEFIEIEEELSVLKIYLEMEQLRMKKDFKFEINTKNLNDIEIPPMMIQPYIENAVKHGLLHKSGEKKLEINMRIVENSFICEIIDNGIGRQKSSEIKARQNQFYESFSGKSLMKRLELFKKQFGGDFGVEYEDLFDENLNPLGTKVTLKSPFKYKY